MCGLVSSPHAPSHTCPLHACPSPRLCSPTTCCWQTDPSGCVPVPACTSSPSAWPCWPATPPPWRAGYGSTTAGRERPLQAAPRRSPSWTARCLRCRRRRRVGPSGRQRVPGRPAGHPCWHHLLCACKPRYHRPSHRFQVYTTTSAGALFGAMCAYNVWYWFSARRAVRDHKQVGPTRRTSAWCPSMPWHLSAGPCVSRLIAAPRAGLTPTPTFRCLQLPFCRYR